VPATAILTFQDPRVTNQILASDYSHDSYTFCGDSASLANRQAPGLPIAQFDIIVNFHDDRAMRYVGGKAKTFHHVINLIPPHEVYIEPFLGVGTVMRAKLPSAIEIGIDLDPRPLCRSGLEDRAASLINGD